MHFFLQQFHMHRRKPKGGAAAGVFFPQGGKGRKVGGFFCFVGQDFFCQFGKQGAKGQQQQGGGDVKDGVHIGNLRHGIVWSKPFNQPDHLGYRQGKDGKQYGTDQIEQQVNDGGAFGVAVGTDGCQHGGDAGTDILPEQHIHSRGEGNQPAGGQRLQNPHRSRGGLNDGGKYCPHQNTQQGVGEGGHQIDKGLVRAQGIHRGTHHIHPDKQDAESAQNQPQMMEFGLFEKHDSGNP